MRTKRFQPSAYSATPAGHYAAPFRSSPAARSHYPPVRRSRHFGDPELTEEEAAELAQAEAAAGEVEEQGGGVEEYISYLNLAAPAIQTIVSGGGSAEEKYETTKAKIENYKKLKKKTSNRLLKLFYDSQINKFQAKLKVYEKEMGEEQSSETFFTAGKVIVVGGALLGLGIMVQVIRVLGSAKRAVDRK
jgi:hypothetical protein